MERPWPPLSMNCCGCSDSDGTTFFKHLIFLLLYGCTTLKPGSVEIFGEHSLPLCGFETDLQPACVGHAWPICLERACLSNKLTERTELKELFSLAYKGSPLIWVANSSIRKSSFCSCLAWDMLVPFLYRPLEAFCSGLIGQSPACCLADGCVCNSRCLPGSVPSFLGFILRLGELQFVGCFLVPYAY